MRNRILPEFQDFLLSRSLVPEKNAPFYAHWVTEFLAFSTLPSIKDEHSEIKSPLDGL
jgi:hypothetical protein